MPETIHCLLVSPRAKPNGGSARGAGLLHDAHVLGRTRLSSIECHDLYFIEGELSPADRRRLALELLSDPVTQTAAWRENGATLVPAGSYLLEVALRPGVTDPVAEQIMRAARVLGFGGLRRAATGQRYLLQGALAAGDLHALARRLLANPVIQRYALGQLEPSFPHAAEASEQVSIVDLCELDEAELLALSRDRRAALDLSEMLAIQAHFRAAG